MIVAKQPTLESRRPPQGLVTRALHLRAAPWQAWLSVLLALVIGSSFGAAQAATQILHTEASEFSPIVVYESRGERCMAFESVDATGRQTCFDPSNPQHMVFQYTRMVMAALLLQPEPQRILVIGLGGGTLPTAFAELFTEAMVDTVEIDPAVLRVARTWFGFEPGPRQRVHLQDGRAFVEEAVARGEQYDLIVLDAYDIEYVPKHLMTQEFLQQVRQLLAPGGVVAANTFTLSGLSDRESATYAAVFGDYLQLKAGNRVILAQPDGLPSAATLKERAHALAPALRPYGVNLLRLQEQLEPTPSWPDQTELLTDDSMN